MADAAAIAADAAATVADVATSELRVGKNQSTQPNRLRAFFFRRVVGEQPLLGGWYSVRKSLVIHRQ